MSGSKSDEGWIGGAYRIFMTAKLLCYRTIIMDIHHWIFAKCHGIKNCKPLCQLWYFSLFLRQGNPGLRLTPFLLPQPLKFWNYRREPPLLVDYGPLMIRIYQVGLSPTTKIPVLCRMLTWGRLCSYGTENIHGYSAFLFSFAVNIQLFQKKSVFLKKMHKVYKSNI